MAPSKQFFDAIVNMLLAFAAAFKAQFPEAHAVVEEHYLRAAWGGTKAFTIAQQFLQKQGLDKLFVAEKQAKRVRFFRNGRAVEKDDSPDLVLYDLLREGGSQYDVKRFGTFDEVVEFEMSGEPFVSAGDKVNMLGLQIQQKDTGRKFELTLDDNYFVEGNILFDRPMVRHFLKAHHNTSLLETDEYEITFIDQEMSVRSLSQKEHILIKGGEAIIIPNEN